MSITEKTKPKRGKPMGRMQRLISIFEPTPPDMPHRPKAIKYPSVINLTSDTGGIVPTHSIKKLKSIFNEKNEPIPGAASPQATPATSPNVQDIPSKMERSITPPAEDEKENMKEGYLTCKVAVLDGRKANDRSWKTVYTVLKGKVLYMYKDKKMAMENLEYEEKPVKLAESDVEIANDYTKRKNVFRVKTDGGS